MPTTQPRAGLRYTAPWIGSRLHPSAMLASLLPGLALWLAAGVLGLPVHQWSYLVPLVVFPTLGVRWGIPVSAAAFACVVLSGGHTAPAGRATERLFEFLCVAAFSGMIQQRKEAELRSKDELAAIDPLTGAYNRRHFHATVPAEIERVNRYGGALSVILFDVDRFKTINDTEGHAVGDRVLRRLAWLVRQNLRSSDRLVRLGGDEFVIVAPGIDEQQARSLAAKLRDVVARHRFAGNTRVTLSLGLAVARPGETAERLLDRADRALYRAKSDGRDRVASGTPEVGEWTAA